jgi:hypothetical protein
MFGLLDFDCFFLQKASSAYGLSVVLCADRDARAQTASTISRSNAPPMFLSERLFDDCRGEEITVTTQTLSSMQFAKEMLLSVLILQNQFRFAFRGRSRQACSLTGAGFYTVAGYVMFNGPH